jgi:RNA polymerase sigma-B factor
VAPVSVSTDHRDRTNLIERHLPLARKLARRYVGRGEPYEDLVQVACVGLIHAVDRFDPARGYAFSTFAVPTILGELKHYFRDASWAVRVQRGTAEKAQAVSAAAAELSARRPTVEQLAQYLEWPLEDVVEGLQAAQAHDTVTLETTAGQADPLLVHADERMTIATACRRLPMIERRVLYLRFAEDLSQSAVAARIGVSQMQVSRLERTALGRLRELAAA